MTSDNHASSTCNYAFVTCTFCGKNGHTKIVWFRKVAFSYQENKVFRTNNNKNVCTYCQRNGHTIDTCYKKNRYLSGYKFYTSRTNQVCSSNEFFF